MKLYKVTLLAGEREELEAITHNEGEFNDHRTRGEDVANILRICMRKVDRIKKRFVEEGLDAALGRKPSQRSYEHKADGEFEAHLVALSCGEPPKGFARWSLRLLADRAVALEYIDSVSHETVRRMLKKTKSNRGGRWVG